MTASRTELQEWERAMRNYFRTSNFHYASKEVQCSYLEERMDKSSYLLLSKLTGHQPHAYDLDYLFNVIGQSVVKSESLQLRSLSLLELKGRPGEPFTTTLC